MGLRKWLPRSNSLRSTLFFYFLPISILPVVIISFYTIHLFEKRATENLVDNALLERNALLSEMRSTENQFFSRVRELAKQPELIAAIELNDLGSLGKILDGYAEPMEARLFSLSGQWVSGPEGEKEHLRVLPKVAVEKVNEEGPIINRDYDERKKIYMSVAHVPVKGNSGDPIAILEVALPFGNDFLRDIKQRRHVDAIILDGKQEIVAASFAVSKEALASLSPLTVDKNLWSSDTLHFSKLGEERYAVFLYRLGAPLGKKKEWGYLALFMSMTDVDAAVGNIKTAMITLGVVLVLLVSLLILLFSNRIVNPIVLLVSAMKEVKSGGVEALPPIESTDEVEYLVESFNEMVANVSATKRALELKLAELHTANDAIKQTQGQLVQSAKLASVGQLVAGVAHELNNPIAFIYSNMHHLSSYVDKIKELIQCYRDLHGKLPSDEREKMERTIKDLEIDYILKDIVDLTQSCQEGAKRTKEIVLGLRNFSRTDDTAPFALADVHDGLRSTVRLLGTEFLGKAEIHEDFGELPPIECNLGQLNQVFMNLLTNAAQAIDGKGDIWIRTSCTEKEVRIDIEDNGRGMAHEALEQIFDPFFSTKGVGEGTGLGLSIAYGIVQKHHGDISVESEERVGSCFTIILPLTQPTTIATQTA